MSGCWARAEAGALRRRSAALTGPHTPHTPNARGDWSYEGRNSSFWPGVPPSTMDLERPWWREQRAADSHQALRYKKLKLSSYKGQSPPLSLRRYFANLIAIVSNHFTLCSSFLIPCSLFAGPIYGSVEHLCPAATFSCTFLSASCK